MITSNLVLRSGGSFLASLRKAGTVSGRDISVRHATAGVRKPPPAPQTERQKAMRAEYLAKEVEWESAVDYSRLTEQEAHIHEQHKEAVENFHFTYDDPATGLKVVTRLRHVLKGTCCGNACRHCVYNHQNVEPERARSRLFNSAFWIEDPDYEEDEEEGFRNRMEKTWEVSDAQVKEFLDEAIRLVVECGEIIADAMDKQKNVEIHQKDAVASEGHGSAVLTETDMKVEQHLIKGLGEKFSDHEFIGEESVSNDGLIKSYSNAPTWIIDPIDGTMNFIHSNPLVCTSVGLTINKKLVAGVVNCPLVGLMYTAIKGKGAWVNGKKLKTSGVEDISKAMMIMELPVGANKDKKETAMANLTEMLDKAHAVRAPGPAALDISWVGAGASDCFFHFGIHCWDMAAGALIVSEAGGVVLDPSGGDFDLMSRDILVCSSRKLADQVLGFLKLYKTDRDLQEKYNYM